MVRQVTACKIYFSTRQSLCLISKTLLQFVMSQTYNNPKSRQNAPFWVRLGRIITKQDNRQIHDAAAKTICYFPPPLHLRWLVITHKMACLLAVSVAGGPREQACCYRCLIIPDPTKLLDRSASAQLPNTTHTQRRLCT